jgi:hypothetical protein
VKASRLRHSQSSHPGEGRDPWWKVSHSPRWTPAFAGVTGEKESCCPWFEVRPVGADDGDHAARLGAQRDAVKDFGAAVTRMQGGDFEQGFSHCIRPAQVLSQGSRTGEGGSMVKVHPAASFAKQSSRRRPGSMVEAHPAVRFANQSSRRRPGSMVEGQPFAAMNPGLRRGDG